MRDYKQLDNKIISDESSLESLKNAESAKLIVISDSHGSKNIVESIIEKFGSESDALCFCGDGMNDLLSLFEESGFQPDLEAKIPKTIIFVQGNGDNSNYQLLTTERHLINVPTSQEFTVAEKRIFMTHGHRFNVYMGTKELKSYAEENNLDLVFYGHTHIANAQQKTNSKSKSKITIMNPGSCALPRSGLPHTFAVVDIKKNEQKIDYQYYEIKWDENGDVIFLPYSVPTGEFNLFW